MNDNLRVERHWIHNTFMLLVAGAGCAVGLYWLGLGAEVCAEDNRKIKGIVHLRQELA